MGRFRYIVGGLFVHYLLQQKTVQKTKRSEVYGWVWTAQEERRGKVVGDFSFWFVVSGNTKFEVQNTTYEKLCSSIFKVQ